MTDWSSLSPLLSDLILVETLREKGGVETCRVRREADGTVLVVKHLSVPQSANQVEGLRLSGAIETDEDAKKYFAERMLDYKNEVDRLAALAEATGLFAYTDAQFIEKADGVGFDLFLFAPERETLPRYLARQPLTHAGAVRLAVQLAGQLKNLHEQGWLHAGVKPENIFVENGEFHIGDLGLVPLASLAYAAIDQSMLGDYTAPELFGITNAPNETIDTYSLGLILYSIFNGNHAPFEDEQTPHSAAMQLRLSGEALQPPLYADYEFASIILKACAFKPEDRYENPQALYDALTAYCKRNILSDELLVPPLVADDVQVSQEAIEEELAPMRVTEENEDEAFTEHFNGVEEDTPAEEEAAEEESAEEDEGDAETQPTEAEEGTDAEPDEEAAEEAVQDAPKKKRSLAWLWWLVGVLACGAAAFCLWWFVLTPTVRDVAVADTAATEIAVTIDADKPASQFAATAADTYGGTVQGVLDGDKFVFSGLKPGASYVITVTTANGGKVHGRSEVTAQTKAALSAADFAAAVDGKTVTLTFTATDADKPWRITVTSADGVEKVYDAQGGSAEISDLPFGTYTAVLTCEGETVMGTTETAFAIEDPNALPVFAAEAVTDVRYEDGAIRWTLDGTFDPAAWQVVCELTDLDEYATLPQAEGAWTFTTENAETAIALTGLAPEASYRAELRSGDVSYGEVTFTTGEAEKYAEHGCTNVFMGIFLAPAKENPRHFDFLTSRGAFAKGETAAFVVEAISTLSQGTWDVAETVVVRNESGKIVDVFAEQTTWDKLWDGKYTSFVFPRTPNVSGKYTVTLLLDGKLVAQKPFEVQ